MSFWNCMRLLANNQETLNSIRLRITGNGWILILVNIALLNSFQGLIFPIIIFF